MTEAEWRRCTDPDRLLTARPGRVSHRQLRLFAVACVRRVQRLLADDRLMTTLAVVERFADGRAGDAERSAAWQAACAASEPGPLLPAGPGAVRAAAAARATADTSPFQAAAFAALDAADAVALASRSGDPDRVRRDERAAQCDLLRELLGPSPEPLAADAAWLTANRGLAPSLARAIYDDGLYDRLPILADALEDAGCAQPLLLGHCRQAGPHLRGCWAVDLLLGMA